jgi:hypothetical protein
MNTDKDNKNRHFQSETQNKVILLSSCLIVLSVLIRYTRLMVRTFVIRYDWGRRLSYGHDFG